MTILNQLTAKSPTPIRPAEPLLLQTEIKFTKSVIHACVQASARDMNDALGVTDPALLDKFLATEPGKKWMQGFKDYIIYSLGTLA